MDTKSDVTRPSLIREDIDETREALTEKLETLEDRLREGVESAKHTVEDKLASVRASVRKLSPLHQTKEHPWLAVGATAAAGFVVARWMGARRDDAFYVDAPRPEPFAEIPRTTDYDAWEPPMPRRRFPSAGPSTAAKLWSAFSENFGDEIQMVKGIAVTRLIDLARDYAKRTAPSFAADIDQVLDSAVGKVPAAAKEVKSEKTEPKREAARL